MSGAADWYRPKAQLVINGEPWTTDNAALYLGAGADGLKVYPAETGAAVAPMFHAAKRPVGGLPAPVNGYIDLVTGQRVSAHFLARAERIFGAIEWRAPKGKHDPIAGFHDGHAVALVMPCRADDPAEKAPSGLPKCPSCEGTGKGEECKTCEGTGICTCHCFDEHDCPDCDGAAYTGTCADCDGSKVWTAPAEGGAA